MTGPVASLLSISVVLLGLGGIGLVAVGMSVGWFVLGLAAIPAMFVEWYYGDLETTR